MSFSDGQKNNSLVNMTGALLENNPPSYKEVYCAFFCFVFVRRTAPVIKSSFASNPLITAVKFCSLSMTVIRLRDKFNYYYVLTILDGTKFASTRGNCGISVSSVSLANIDKCNEY